MSNLGKKHKDKPNTSPTKQHYFGINELWDEFKQYAALVKSNPKKVEDYVGKDGNRVHREREAPLTFDGFVLYCIDKFGYSCRQYFYPHNKKADYSDYKDVVDRILMSIRNDQIVGGMTNIYNHGITARLNGLKENIEESGNKDITIKVKYERKGNTDNT